MLGRISSQPNIICYMGQFLKSHPPAPMCRLFLRDSRAVMLYREKGVVKVRQLTWDHKPNLPDELQHICKSGGIVYPLEDVEM